MSRVGNTVLESRSPRSAGAATVLGVGRSATATASRGGQSKFYLQATQLDPANYTHYENAGISYYSGGDFAKAVQYFEKAVQFSNANTGKSEFFMAMSYIALGKKEKICAPLNTAKLKGYQGVDSYLAQYCK